MWGKGLDTGPLRAYLVQGRSRDGLYKSFQPYSSFLVWKSPAKLLFKGIALVPLQDAVVLQPTDDNSGPDTDRFRKIVDGFIRKTLLSQELAECARWNQCIGRKAAGLRFILLHLGINDPIRHVLCRIVDNKRALVPVKNDVSNFMEKGEPELVVSLVPKR